MGETGLENVLCTPQPGQQLIATLTPRCLIHTQRTSVGTPVLPALKTSCNWRISSPTAHFSFLDWRSTLLLAELDLCSLQAGNPLEAAAQEQRTAPSPPGSTSFCTGVNPDAKDSPKPPRCWPQIPSSLQGPEAAAAPLPSTDFCSRPAPGRVWGPASDPGAPLQHPRYFLLLWLTGHNQCNTAKN